MFRIWTRQRASEGPASQGKMKVRRVSPNTPDWGTVAPSLLLSPTSPQLRCTGPRHQQDMSREGRTKPLRLGRRIVKLMQGCFPPPTGALKPRGFACLRCASIRQELEGTEDETGVVISRVPSQRIPSRRGCRSLAARSPFCCMQKTGSESAGAVRAPGQAASRVAPHDLSDS